RVVLLPRRWTRGQLRMLVAALLPFVRRRRVSLIDGAELWTPWRWMCELAVPLEACGTRVTTIRHDFGHVGAGVKRIELVHSLGVRIGWHIHADDENRFWQLVGRACDGDLSPDHPPDRFRALAGRGPRRVLLAMQPRSFVIVDVLHRR